MARWLEIDGYKKNMDENNINIRTRLYYAGVVVSLALRLNCIADP